MKPHYLIAGAILLGLVLWLGKTLMVSETSRISNRLDELAETISKTKPETIIVAAIEAKKTAEFFSDEIVLRPGAPFGEMRDKEALTRQMTQVRHMLNHLKVRVIGLEVVVNGKTAEVGCTLQANYSAGDGPGRELREFRLKMVKQGGEWLIRELDLESGM